MSQIEPTERGDDEIGAAERRLEEAAKQLRIARESLDDGAELAHVEVAIRETEAARYHLE